MQQMKAQVDAFKRDDLVGESQKKLALSIFLYASVIVMFSFSLLNAFCFQLYSIAFFELIIASGSFLSLYLLRRTYNYYLIAGLFVFAAAVVLLVLTLYFRLEESALIWNSIFPVIAFYLLGNKKGAIVHVLFSALLLAGLFFGFHKMPSEPTQQTLYNLGGLLGALGAFIYYYEHTKNEAIQQVYLLSFLDELTQIANRKMFNKVLFVEKARSERYNQALSLLMLDIDHFKQVNDRFGHVKGDKVLVEFADLLKESIRECDSLFRWGGEEFIIILPSQSIQNADSTARRLKTIIEKHSFKDVGTITSSFGVAKFEKDEPVEEFIKRLDKALYEAKAQGRNQVISV